MATLNEVTLIGRICADPEIKTTQSGVPLANFRIAVDRKYKSASGERETDFLTCVAFRRTAEFIQQYVGKGRLVCVSGSIQTRSWEAQDGSRRSSVEIMAESVETLDRSTQEGGGAGAARGEREGRGYAQPQGDPFAAPVGATDPFAIDDPFANE